MEEEEEEEERSLIKYLKRHSPQVEAVRAGLFKFFLLFYCIWSEWFFYSPQVEAVRAGLLKSGLRQKKIVLLFIRAIVSLKVVENEYARKKGVNEIPSL